MLYQNERLVIRERKIRNGTVYSKLIVKSLRPDDGGQYSCIANNHVRNITHTAAINVYGLPFVHQMENVTVAAGQDAVIRCYVSGHPITEIQWERG